MSNRQRPADRRRRAIAIPTALLLAVSAHCLLSAPVQGFVQPRHRKCSSSAGWHYGTGDRPSVDLRQRRAPLAPETSLFVSTDVGARSPSTSSGGEDDGNDGEDATMDEETLLRTVTSSYLRDLCTQMGLATGGGKAELLARLRSHAEARAAAEKERRRRLAEEIEAGVDAEGNPTKHRLVDEGGGAFSGSGRGAAAAGEAAEEDLEEGGIFYFELPRTAKADGAASSSSRGVTVTAVTDEMKGGGGSSSSSSSSSDNNPITVPPPPPDVEPNADGERVVTVYSTKDDNDMTGMNAESLMGEPGREGMMGGYSRTGGGGGDGGTNPEDTLAGGPFGDASGTRRRRADERELDEAREAVEELVQGLLAMTGAPAFRDEFSGGLQLLGGDEDDGGDGLGDGVDLGMETSFVAASQPQLDFVGFDPSNVPADMLTAASRYLRAGGGQALREVLSDFEVQAVGHDGMAADDVAKGGGHYREVRKVGAFLEGYRRAEVRRIARETASMLLDKLVTEDVRGLDLMLATMGRGGDDGAGGAGELNDSLLEYLNDAIREQEKKVEQLLGSQEMQERRQGRRPTEGSIRKEKGGDEIDGLWNVTTDEAGEIMESIDPKDPNVQMALKRELEKPGDGAKANLAPMPTTPPEQLLLLLTCLRDRVKAEAAFSTDEKGRNLRILAYVLHATDDREREGIITKELGSSLDRLDSFLELVASAIDYAESTSHTLQPSKSSPLNVALLKHIKGMVENINERQAWKASGISARDNK